MIRDLQKTLDQLNKADIPADFLEKSDRDKYLPQLREEPSTRREEHSTGDAD